MTAEQMRWMLTFLERTVPRGETELAQVENLMATLRGALLRISRTQVTPDRVGAGTGR
jgi:hypothetical protein